MHAYYVYISLFDKTIAETTYRFKNYEYRILLDFDFFLEFYVQNTVIRNDFF